MSFRVYTMQNSGSFQRVGSGMRYGLKLHGISPTGVKFLDVASHYEDDEPEGVGADVGMLLGPPIAAKMLTEGHHQSRMVMLAPNSDQIGRDLALELEKHATVIMVPSKWAKEVVEKHLDLPVRVVPHGVNVTEEFLEKLKQSWGTTPELFERDQFMVTHFSTSASNRKGTLNLVRAWEMMGLSSEKAQLNLVLDDPVRVWLLERMDLPEGVVVKSRLPAFGSAEAGIACAGFVCQPSTGEGFGMIPLEARALGVPVIATACSGHSEHMEEAPGVVVIPHLPPEPVFDELPGAQRYRVTSEAIADALHHAYQFRKSLTREARDAAPSVVKRWHWSKVVSSLVPLLQE